MITEYVAQHIEAFTGALASITRTFGNIEPWWRGHAEVDWRLAPRLYRDGYAHREHNLLGRFRMKAKPRYSRCPGPNEPLAWLFLMQHYRLPTRLLDWTESPLTAMFFAVSDERKDNSDGAVWALCPSELNLHQMQEKAICMPRSQRVHELSFGAFVPSTAKDSRILSVIGEQSDIRHMVQQCAFTLHGCGSNIEDLPQAESFLVKIRIPAGRKKYFRRVLRLYGLSRATLFPDLENLAEELTTLDFERHQLVQSGPLGPNLTPPQAAAAPDSASSARPPAIG